MTRPVFEPTPDRGQAKLGFSANQLFRRPSRPSCPCDFDWIYAQGTETASASDNSLTDITWSQYAIAPGSEAFSVNTAQIPFNLLLDGWYMFWLQFEWNAAGFTDQRQYNIAESGGGSWDNNFSSYKVRSTSSDPWGSGITVTWGPLKVIPTLRTKLQVIQNSGGSRDINSAAWTCIYLGPALGVDGTWSDLITDF